MLNWLFQLFSSKSGHDERVRQVEERSFEAINKADIAVNRAEKLVDSYRKLRPTIYKK